MASNLQQPLPGLSRLQEALKAKAGTLRTLGIVFIVLGSIAIIVPELATIFATTFIGAMVLMSGLTYLWLAFHMRGAWNIVADLLLGALSVFAGAYLLIWPLEGAAILTIVMAAWFIATGLLKAWHAFEMRGVHGWIWGVVSGLVSILLGVIIFSGLPGSATWALGLLLGIDLLFFGWALVALHGAVKRA